MSSLINLIDQPDAPPHIEILQLYQDLELLRLGQPPRHVLFILGRMAGDVHNRLLLLDPPPNLAEDFRIQEEAAALYTRTPDADAATLPVPRLGTRAGGTAHIRLGEHFLDIYTQQYYSIVHFPALGITYSGEFGSDVALPRLAEGDDGEDALETARVLAALVKARPVNLLVPRMGELEQSVVPIMERLAADVAYLHNLRRIAPALPPQNTEAAEESESSLDELAATLLPSGRRTETAQRINRNNVRRLAALHQGN